MHLTTNLSTQSKSWQSKRTTNTVRGIERTSKPTMCEHMWTLTGRTRQGGIVLLCSKCQEKVYDYVSTY